jgi:hypothetical protein
MTAAFHVLPNDDYCPLLWHRVVWYMYINVFEKPLTSLVISGDESATQGKPFSNIRQTHTLHTILSVPSNIPYHTPLICHAKLFLPPWYGAAGSSETSIYIWLHNVNIPDDGDHSYQHGNVKSYIVTFDGNTAWVTDSTTTEIINKQFIN